MEPKLTHLQLAETIIKIKPGIFQHCESFFTFFIYMRKQLVIVKSGIYLRMMEVISESGFND